MTFAEGQKFAHRANRDGTFDSVCLKCFKTVAFDSREATLSDKECEHVCEDVVLDRLSRGKSKAGI